MAPSTEVTESFSLFSGAEGGLDEAAVERLLDASVAIPEYPRIAVLMAPDALSQSYRYYGMTEQQLGAREAYLDTLRAQLLPAGAREVDLLPSLLVPANPTVPVLREVAVRLQVDVLLVFRVGGGLFQNYRAFRSDQLKAYATCEAVLLDVRTGAIPFTTVATRDYQTTRQDGDLNDAETRQRAEQRAVLLALGAMGREVAAYLGER